MLRTRVIVGPTAAAISSAVAAVALTGLAVLDASVPLLEPKVGAPAPVTVRIPERFVTRTPTRRSSSGQPPRRGAGWWFHGERFSSPAPALRHEPPPYFA